MQGVTPFALQSYVISFPVFCIVDILSQIVHFQKAYVSIFVQFTN